MSQVESHTSSDELAQDEFVEKYVICNNGGGGCHSHCGLIVTVNKRTGEVVKTEGNPNSPQNEGSICHSRQIVPNWQMKWLDMPHQLMYAKKRVGKRGEGKWEEIPYDQALDEIAAKLKELKEKYGPECLAYTEGTMRSDHGFLMRSRFNALWGNPQNVFDPGTICARCLHNLDMMYVGLHCLTNGPTPGSGLIVTPSNKAESFPAVWRAMLQAKEAGTKLMILDPRLSESARNADMWLQLRPGTDSAILLGWLHIIIEENLIDREFLEEWTNSPFLVRTDTHKLLKECDVVKGGSAEKYMAWDSATMKLIPYNAADSVEPADRGYESSTFKPSLEGGAGMVKLADGKTVECKTVWQLLVERVAPFTPEEIENISWVPKEKIIESARMYATLKPAGFLWGEPTDAHGRGSMNTERTRVVLAMVTGNLDVEGGTQALAPGVINNGKLWIRDSILELQDMLTDEVMDKMIGADKYKVMGWPGFKAINKEYVKAYGIPANLGGHATLAAAPLLAPAILEEKPYPIKAIITWSSNAMCWMPNTKHVYEALKSDKLELHVVLEHVMTPTAELADYVLPAAAKCIEYPYVTDFEDQMNIVFVSDSILDEPRGDRRTELQFFKGLADRLGFGQYFPWKTNRELSNWRLGYAGLNIEEAAKTSILFGDQFPYESPGYLAVDNPQFEALHENTDGTFNTVSKPVTGKRRGFLTRTNKAEIWPTILEDLGYDPLPDYIEPPESPYATPELAKEYPFVLSTGARFQPMFHSEGRQFGMGFREQHPDPICDLHIEDARELGIANGDWVWIESPRGRIMQRARVSSSILPGCVNAEHSWWYPELPGEEPWLHGIWISSANVLTDDSPESLDPLIGAWNNRALLCKVYKAEGLSPQVLAMQLGSQGNGKK